MSRLRKKLPAALLRALIAWLMALGLGMPLLCGAALYFLLPRYMLLCGAVALACAIFSLRKWLLEGALGAAMLLEIVLFLAGRGFFRQTMTLIQAMYRDMPLAAALYGDWLCALLAVFLTLFCNVLSSPDIDVALPVTIVSAVLSVEWMIGLRRESLYMLPVLPALLLTYAHTYSYQSAPAAQSPRLSPWAVPIAALLLGLSVLIAPPEGARNETLAALADKLWEAIPDSLLPKTNMEFYSLERDGWMPLGRDQLGGVPDPHEQVILRVTAGETLYLRGAVRDTYRGTAWINTLKGRSRSWNSAAQQERRNEIVQTAYPLSATPPAATATVQFASLGTNTLFTPQRIRSLSTGNNMAPCFDLSSEVFLSRSLRAMDTYTVKYLSMKATDPGMAAWAEQHAALDDPLYQKAQAQYLQLPESIDPEIYGIASSVTAGSATDWQRAVALRNYLRGNYGYTTQVETPPEGADFVSWFLLREQKGYCTYFASAMTVLARMAGLPARYVEGYLVKPEAGGVTAVRGSNAHAWTEIYINGLGWVTFDATPGMGDEDRSGSVPPPPPEEAPQPPQPQTQQTPTLTPSPSPTPSAAPTPDRTPSPSPSPALTPSPSPALSPTPTPTAPPDAPPDDAPALPWLWLLLVLALLLLLAWRVRVTEPRYRSFHAGSDEKALLLLWAAILRCAALLKSPMRPEDTPLTFAQRAGRALSVPLLETAQAVSALRYGRHPVRRGSLRSARDAYSALYERLNLAQKLIFALRNAFRFKK